MMMLTLPKQISTLVRITLVFSRLPSSRRRHRHRRPSHGTDGLGKQQQQQQHDNNHLLEEDQQQQQQKVLLSPEDNNDKQTYKNRPEPRDDRWNNILEPDVDDREEEEEVVVVVADSSTISSTNSSSEDDDDDDDDDDDNNNGDNVCLFFLSRSLSSSFLYSLPTSMEFRSTPPPLLVQSSC